MYKPFRLMNRFLRVGAISTAAMAALQSAVPPPWNLVLTGLLSGIMAAADKGIRMKVGEKK